ncbi:MAG TPA: hypothetical protein VFN67_31940 [Polyangiales bacterium]|nr:hypothetical protein [Polyangiales bacterium]
MSSLKHRLLVSGLLSASLSLLGFGCATGSGDVRHGAGVGYWEGRVVTMPSRQSPIAAMAFGRGGSSEPASDLGVDDALAALDRSAVAQPRAAKLVAETKTAKPVAPPIEQTQAPAAESRVHLDQQFPVLLAENTQESRYASREAQSDKQQKFAGGDAIVITSGAIVLVLLIVLLILLLR